jgi:hypothetical protein
MENPGKWIIHPSTSTSIPHALPSLQRKSSKIDSFLMESAGKLNRVNFNREMSGKIFIPHGKCREAE